jgi:hypothetical protein
LDCCYSAAATVSKGNSNNAASIGRKIIENKSAMVGEGKCILAACHPLISRATFYKSSSFILPFHESYGNPIDTLPVNGIPRFVRAKDVK